MWGYLSKIPGAERSGQPVVVSPQTRFQPPVNYVFHQGRVQEKFRTPGPGWVRLNLHVPGPGLLKSTRVWLGPRSGPGASRCQSADLPSEHSTVVISFHDTSNNKIIIFKLLHIDKIKIILGLATTVVKCLKFESHSEALDLARPASRVLYPTRYHKSALCYLSLS